MARLQLPNPPPSSPAVRAVMQSNRARDTAPERTLRAALRAVGQRGYRLNWRRAPGRPDICWPGRRVAVFVHGCYWHHCPRCHPALPRSNPAFWARKFELNHERDARKRRQLEEAGWRVHEVWECDIRERLGGVLVEISASLVHPSGGGRSAGAGQSARSHQGTPSTSAKARSTETRARSLRLAATASSTESKGPSRGVRR